VGLVPVPVSLISSSLSIYDVGVVSCADASVSGPGPPPLYIYDKGLGVSAIFALRGNLGAFMRLPLN
jgi:hypothetical protein